MPSYYKNWDKLAKELEDQDSDGEEGEVKGYLEAAKNPVWKEERKAETQAEMLQKTRGARRNVAMVVKGARQKQVSTAEEFKSQGNSYFVSLEYAKAIECYTRSLNAVETAPDSA